MEYTLKSGKIITDAEIEALAEAAETGSLPGQWSGNVVIGRPRLAEKPKAPSEPPTGQRRVLSDLSLMRPDRLSGRGRPLYHVNEAIGEVGLFSLRKLDRFC